VLGFAVLIALNQLQIGAAIVNTLFMALVGALALAAALAFGLGGRDVAARILEDWYAHRRAVAEQAGRLADAARREGPAPDAVRPATGRPGPATVYPAAANGGPRLG